MTLEACPDCRANLSSTAPSCPACGWRRPADFRPFWKWTKIIGGTAAGIAALVILPELVKPEWEKDIDRQYRACQMIARPELKDLCREDRDMHLQQHELEENAARQEPSEDYKRRHAASAP